MARTTTVEARTVRLSDMAVIAERGPVDIPARRAIRSGALRDWGDNEPMSPDALWPPSPRKQPIPADLRWEVWERDDFTCQGCGARRYLEVDHVFPEALGGETVAGNLQTLCQRCNRSKGARIDPESF